MREQRDRPEDYATPRDFARHVIREGLRRRPDLPEVAAIEDDQVSHRPLEEPPVEVGHGHPGGARVLRAAPPRRAVRRLHPRLRPDPQAGDRSGLVGHGPCPDSGAAARPGAAQSGGGDWLYDRLAEWSANHADGHVSPHVFRKTSLQYARIGEEATMHVAEDARVSASVVKKHYVKETDDLLRKRSNRTYHRILAGLSPEVARRYGHLEGTLILERRVQEALAAKNWTLAAVLTSQLAKQRLRKAVRRPPCEIL